MTQLFPHKRRYVQQGCSPSRQTDERGNTLFVSVGNLREVECHGADIRQRYVTDADEFYHPRADNPAFESPGRTFSAPIWYFRNF